MTKVEEIESKLNAFGKVPGADTRWLLEQLREAELEIDGAAGMLCVLCGHVDLIRLSSNAAGVGWYHGERECRAWPIHERRYQRHNKA